MGGGPSVPRPRRSPKSSAGVSGGVEFSVQSHTQAIFSNEPNRYISTDYPTTGLSALCCSTREALVWPNAVTQRCAGCFLLFPRPRHLPRGRRWWARSRLRTPVKLIRPYQQTAELLTRVPAPRLGPRQSSLSLRFPTRRPFSGSAPPCISGRGRPARRPFHQITSIPVPLPTAGLTPAGLEPRFPHAPN